MDDGVALPEPSAVRGVPVASFGGRPLAELARSYLQDNGVTALVDADDGNGTQPEVGFVTGGARVVVAPADLDRARELLAAVAGDAPAPRSHSPVARWVAGTVAATMAAIGVWTTLVVLLM